MAHVLLDDTSDWELSDAAQDIRGREVRDANGTPIGTVGGMIVDTDARVVDTIVLTDGSRFRAGDVSIDDDAVYVTTYGAPVGVATRPYADGHGVRPRGRPAERVEAPGGAAGFAAYDDDFRSHYRDAYRDDDDLEYDDYAPAYRAGYDFAYDDRFAGRDYAAAEADLREAYYRRHGYPMSDNLVWSRVKGAVRHAFERARSAVR